MKPPKKRNAIAKALRSPHLRQRVVRSKKTYTRKGRGNSPLRRFRPLAA